MTQQVDLVWLGATSPSWSAGRVLAVEPRPDALSKCIKTQLDRSPAVAWLFWHSRFGAPDPGRVLEVLSRPGDLWHAGLRLRMGGRPGLIDFVAPTWMLNRDPGPEIEATSWRLSLESCLIKTDVLRIVGPPHAAYRSLAAASLEFGHRCVSSGVLTRHIPWLVAEAAEAEDPTIPFEDEVRFLMDRYGSFWSRWAVLRAVVTGYVRPWQGWTALRRSRGNRRAPSPGPFHETPGVSGATTDLRSTVTVLVPTVDRYPYLRPLLEQLRVQTVSPTEIIVVDQTSANQRDLNLARDFSDLPLKVFAMDQAGQCSSRNLGIAAARGDFILFLDDDDEIPPDLIERHLSSLARFGSEVSSGVAEEAGAGPLPEAFRLVRASDVFPTNNSLIRKGALCSSGLFDLAYDRGSRADGDLGMRLYLAGKLMVLNPGISVFHHHAPSGGLRVHRARVVTRASSRRRLMQRHLPSPTELYLERRYFSARQAREANWHRAFGSLRGRGTLGYRAAKSIVSALLLPHTLWIIRKRSRQAARMLQTFPRIPPYRGSTDEGHS